MGYGTCEKCNCEGRLRVRGMSAGIAVCDACDAQLAAMCEANVKAVIEERDALRAEVAQYSKDWDALNLLLLETLGTEEERESPDDAIEEFDPWATLRRHAGTLAIVESAKEWRLSHHTGAQKSSRDLIAAVDAALAPPADTGGGEK